MVVHSQWASHALRSSIWGDGPIAVFRAEGQFRVNTAPPMLTHAQLCLAEWRSAGLVGDYSRARVETTADELLASVTTVIAQDGALSLPNALVVRPEDLTTWRQYARMMAQVGILRGVFLNYDDALRWVSAQATIFTLDRDHRTRAAAR